MPELPEVEYGRRLLARFLINTKISKVNYPDVEGLSKRFMDCTPQQFADGMMNRKVLDIKRHGKYLWFEMADKKGPTPIFHFGMSGGFRIKSAPDVTYLKELEHVKKRAKNEIDGQCESYVYDENLDSDLSWPPRFTRIQFFTETGHDVCYTDLRKFGRFHLVSSESPRSCLPLSKLGFDPYLDMPKLNHFIELMRSYRSANIELKALLLDQTFCAGIGNWIADEILYQCCFHPRKRLNVLTEEDLKLLHKNIDYVIRTAVDAGGSEQFPVDWLFHYRWKNRKETQDYHKMKIQFDTVGGRTSAFVPKRQLLSNNEKREIEEKLDMKKSKRALKTEEQELFDDKIKIENDELKSKPRSSKKKRIVNDDDENAVLQESSMKTSNSNYANTCVSSRPQRTCKQRNINYHV